MLTLSQITLLYATSTQVRWVVSSAGRAAPLQGVGHRFDPCTTHQLRRCFITRKSTFYGPVVQLVRMPACHAGGRGFESRPVRHFQRNLQTYLKPSSIPLIYKKPKPERTHKPLSCRLRILLPPYCLNHFYKSLTNER